MCRSNCKICNNIVISDAVSLVTGTLVIDVPAATFSDCQRLCLVVAQTIPTDTTITAPVAISIGGDTTTLYPVVRCDGTAVTACSIRTRTRYPLRVNTTATSAVFTMLGALPCGINNNLATIPATT